MRFIMSAVDPGNSNSANTHQVLQNIIDENYESKQVGGQQKEEAELTDLQANESEQQRTQVQRTSQQQSEKGAEVQAGGLAAAITSGKKGKTAQTGTTSQAGRVSAGMGSAKGSLTKGATDTEKMSTLLTSTNPTNKPGLAKAWGSLIDVEGDSISSTKGINLIAIMAEVMVLQAKSNQDFFSSLWQGASESMNMEAQLAPIVATATLQAGLAQAAQSKAQGSQALIEGCVNLAVFGVSLGIGAYMGIAEADAEGLKAVADEANKQTDTTLLTKAPGEAVEGISGAEDVEDVASAAGAAREGTDGSAAADDAEAEGVTESDAAAAKTTAAKQAAKTQTAEEASIAEQTDKGSLAAKRSIWDKISNAWKNSSPVLKGLTAASNAAQMLNGLTQGITGTITYVYQNKIAAYQIQGAEWQAIEKMGDIQVQFFGQAFGRAEGMSQQAQQNISTALQLLEGIVSSITQTVTSGFSNI